MSALVHCLELCCAGKEFIDTSIKTQPSQRVHTTSSLSSSPAATASGSTVVSVKHGKTSSCALPTHAEMELPATEESKPLPALSSDSLPRSADVAPLIGGCEQEEKEPEPASCKPARGAGATRVHPSAAVTSEEKTDDEVDDEEEEEDQEEEEDDGDMAEDVEEIEGGTKPKKGSRKKVAAKRKSAATDRAGKRSRAVEGSKSRAGKVEGAPKQSLVLVNAGKRKKTPVVERTSKASNTRAGKAQGSK